MLSLNSEGLPVTVSASKFPERWRVAVFLAAAAALNYGDRAVFSVVLPSIRSEFNLSDVSLGLLGSLFLWSYALVSPLAGTFADRFSRSSLVLISLLSWSVVTTLMGAVNGFLFLGVLRVALGLAESLYMPSAVALLADHHSPATRARAMSLHIVGFNLGMILGSALAGGLAERFGWRCSFWVLGLTGILLACSSRTFLCDVAPLSSFRAPSYSVAAALRFLIRAPTFYMLLSVAMLAGVAVWIFFNWFPLYLRDRYSFSLGVAGLAAMLMLQVSSMLGIVIGGWISDRLAVQDIRQRLLVFGIGYLATAPCLLLFLFRPEFATVCVAVSSFSFFRSLAAVNELPVLCEVVPVQFRSTAIGCMNTAATAAGGLGVLAAAMLKQRLGLETVFAGLSVVFLIAAAAMVIGYRSFICKDLERAKQWESEHSANPA